MDCLCLRLLGLKMRTANMFLLLLSRWGVLMVCTRQLQEWDARGSGAEISTTEEISRELLLVDVELRDPVHALQALQERV